MLSRVQTISLSGLNCERVEVETDLAQGFPSFTIVGLPDTSVQEAKERIRSAIKNSGFEFPSTRHITINLAPADIPKEGPAYDLPMAVAIVMGQLEKEVDYHNSIFIGELALNGALRRINGALPVAIFMKEMGITTLFLPEENAAEASLIEGVAVVPVKNLQQLINHLLNQEMIPLPESKKFAETIAKNYFSALDMQDVKGQSFAKRALEIAAAGGHNILMSGPPGSGKTLLAKTFVTILPAMTFEETLEATKIYSIAGLLSPHKPLVTTRPFRSPHHTASGVALVGGGKNPRPGEITLAHRGVLFLDEFPEFSRQVLENLRQPLEDGVITISRASGTCSFPARFMLVASQNPCPCGYYGDSEKTCTCTPIQISKYQKKISGPLLDRIDLHVEVPRLKFLEIENNEEAESSSVIQKRVDQARQIQQARFVGTKNFTNAEMTNEMLNRFCYLGTAQKDLLRSAVDNLHLSTRTYHRLIKVARTIADLQNEPDILVTHLAEALQYRTKNEH